MRTLATGERAILGGQQLATKGRLEVQDSDGTWRNISALNGFDFFDSADWQGNPDDAVQTATFVLKRQAGPQATNVNISPLAAGSEVNRDLLDDYVPFVRENARIRLFTATGLPGFTPGGDPTNGWHKVFDGKVDDVEINRRDVTLSCRDLGAFLQTASVEEKTSYGDPTPPGTALEEIMQAIINDWVPNPPTLVVPTPSGAFRTTHDVVPNNVMEILQGYAAEIGWVCRYEWIAGGDDMELRFYRPEEKFFDDALFGPDEYLSSGLRLSDADIRNRVKAILQATDGTVLLTSEKEDPDSIGPPGNYGVRFMQLVLDTATGINTQEELDLVAQAAVDQLSTKFASHKIETFYFWAVERGDRHGYMSNQTIYDTMQTMYVVSFRHSISNGRGRTAIEARGKPVARLRRWLPPSGVVGDPMVDPFPGDGGGGSGGNCRVHNSVVPHYSALKNESFGLTYDTYANWYASLVGRWGSRSGSAVFNSLTTYDVNGCKVLEVTEGTNLTVTADVSALGIKKLWARSTLWMDSTMGNGAVFLGPEVLMTSGGNFAQVPVYENYTDPAPSFKPWSNFDDFAPDAYAEVDYADVKGRWVDVIMYWETGIEEPRFCMWVEGALVIDSVWGTDGTGATVYQIGLKLGIDDYGGATGKKVRYQNIEFVNGDEEAEPYCDISVPTPAPLFAPPPVVTFDYENTDEALFDVDASASTYDVGATFAWEYKLATSSFTWTGATAAGSGTVVDQVQLPVSTGIDLRSLGGNSWYFQFTKSYRIRLKITNPSGAFAYAERLVSDRQFNTGNGTGGGVTSMTLDIDKDVHYFNEFGEFPKPDGNPTANVLNYFEPNGPPHYPPDNFGQIPADATHSSGLGVARNFDGIDMSDGSPAGAWTADYALDDFAGGYSGSVGFTVS